VYNYLLLTKMRKKNLQNKGLIRIRLPLVKSKNIVTELSTCSCRL